MIIAREIFAALDVIQSRAVQIGAAANQKRHRFRDRLQHFAASFARRKFRISREMRDIFERIRRDLFVDRVVQKLRLLGIFLSPSLPRFLPAIVIGEQLLFVRGEIFVSLF